MEFQVGRKKYILELQSISESLFGPTWKSYKLTDVRLFVRLSLQSRSKNIESFGYFNVFQDLKFGFLNFLKISSSIFLHNDAY